MPSDSHHPERDHDVGPSPPGDGSIETILDAYLEELAAGGQPDQDAYISKHPHLADALRGVFRTLDFVEATSCTLRAGKLERGSRLGEYRITREVARGGMGVVYEAVQTSLNRRVALKVLPTGALLSPTAAERFAREAATTGQLHHTNIVPVYAVGEEDGIHYYAMQFIEGRSLSDHIKNTRESGAAPSEEYIRRVARWGMQIADALAHAHSQGIVHRDIKPSNLLLDERDDVWISDFGLARVDAMASLTVSGDVVGTARYMSPEQARGGRERVDARTDIYSLGITLHELLTLTPAFDGSSRDDVLTRIALTDPIPLRQINPKIPRDLETIVAKCAAKNPEDRYTSARDVSEDFHRFLEDEPIHARRTPVAVRMGRYVRKNRIHVAGVILATALALATVTLIRQVRRVEGARLLDQGYAAVLFDRDFARAETMLDGAEDRGVRGADLYIYRSLIPLLNNEPARAIPKLEEALRRDPESVNATLGLALAYAATGDFYNAQRKLDRYPEEKITTALGWYLRGLALSKTTRTEAIDAYNKAISVRADFTPAIEARAHYRGIRLLTEDATEELNAMLNDFDALVIFRPNDAGAYAARGRGWLFATAHASRTPDLNSRALSWRKNAQADIEKALSLKSDTDSLVWVRQGVLARYSSDFSLACAAFEHAIAVDRAAGREPHPYRIHELALARHARGELQSALDLVEPASAASPGYCPTVLHEAMLLAELNRMDEARAVIMQSLKAQRSNANGVFLSAVTAELLGKTSAAREAVELYASTSGDSATGSSDTPPSLALAYLAGEIDAEAFRASVSAPGRRCEAEYLVAIRTLAGGDRDGARTAFEACLNTGVFIFSEYRFAQLLLVRMESDPAWPTWLP